MQAPADVPDESIERAVREKRQWIYEKTRHSQKYEVIAASPGKELVTGESALYLGRNYRIELVAGGEKEVRFNRYFLVPSSTAAERKCAMRVLVCRQSVKTALAPRGTARSRDRGHLQTGENH